jgi:hypothetical protein
MESVDNVDKKEFAYNTGHYKYSSKSYRPMSFINSNEIIDALTLTQPNYVIISGMGGLGMCSLHPLIYIFQHYYPLKE